MGLVKNEPKRDYLTVNGFLRTCCYVCRSSYILLIIIRENFKTNISVPVVNVQHWNSCDLMIIEILIALVRKLV